jgi:hypothetical protein
MSSTTPPTLLASTFHKRDKKDEKRDPTDVGGDATLAVMQSGAKLIQDFW